MESFFLMRSGWEFAMNFEGWFWRMTMLLVVASLGTRASIASGFVHIAREKPRLPATRDQPEIGFVWNGSFPKIGAKDAIEGGIFADSSDREVFEAILRLSFDKWNQVEGAFLRLTLTEDSEISDQDDDEVYAIVVKSLDSQVAAAAALVSHRGDSDAKNRSANYRSARVIHDCDIVVASRKVDADELYATLVHELGHCLGLGHPHTNAGAIMSYSRTSTSPNLGLDDMAGAIFLYPQDDFAVKELVACGSVGAPVRDSSTELLWLWLILPVVGAYSCGIRRVPI